MNILITGGNGYIAKSLYNSLSDKYNITSISRKNFDLTNYDDVCFFFKNQKYDIVLHTAIVGGTRLKTDEDTVFEENISMFNNLVANKDHFSKLITFGSGAEIFHGDTPYANSKREIAKKILDLPNFYNLRIFAVFDHNEWNTRFIKSNIIRYLKQEPMLVHSNKIMDFFYMEDLISLVEFYIKKDNLEKEINCSYTEKYSLKHIANIINNLDNYEVPVLIENKNNLSFYCGDSELPIKPIGIIAGIKETYLKLKGYYE